MRTILLVDDELACRHPMARLLQMENYNVLEAENGMQALTLLKKSPPDLILLDMVMPQMDGVELLNIIRANAKWKNIPVFLVTGHHIPKQLARARELGIQEYLFKGDIPFVRVLELIKKHLGEPFFRPKRGRKPRNPQPVEQKKAYERIGPPDPFADKSDPFGPDLDEMDCPMDEMSFSRR
jgi:response regulator RpfG family c-di-GMP phosphodiesterase